MKMKKNMSPYGWKEATTVLKEVIVTDQRDRTEAGLIRPNPKTIINLPSASNRCRKPDQNICWLQ